MTKHIDSQNILKLCGFPFILALSGQIIVASGSLRCLLTELHKTETSNLSLPPSPIFDRLKQVQAIPDFSDNLRVHHLMNHAQL
jgi:hypothetical protein